MIRALALIIVMTVTGCSPSEPESAKEIFEKRLRDRGVAFEIVEHGLYVIKLEGNSITANLSSVSKDYVRDGDPESIRRFADQVMEGINEPTPDWESVQPYLRFQLEPDDSVDGFAGILHSRVADGLVKVFVYTPKDGSKIAWISEDTVRDWNVTPDQVFSVAEKNMRKIASEAKIEVEDGNGITLGMISTEETPFKASLILADNFRDLIEAKLGFPVYAVAPCRDFVFIIPHANKDALG